MSFGGCFYFLTGHDVVGDVNASLQSSFSQRHGASFDELHGAKEQIAKHASQSVSILYTSTDEIGQRATRLSRAIVAIIHFRTDRSCDEENEASPSPCCVGMVQVVRYGPLYRTGSHRILLATRICIGRVRNVSRSSYRAVDSSIRTSTAA